MAPRVKAFVQRGNANAATQAVSGGLCRRQVDDLGGALLGLACEAPLDGHARHQLLMQEAVRVLLGLPHGRDQDSALGRSRRVVDLPLGKAPRGWTTASIALYCCSVPPGQKCVIRYATVNSSRLDARAYPSRPHR